MRLLSLAQCRQSLLGALFIMLVAARAFSASPDFERQQTAQSPARPFPSAQYIPSHDYDTHHIALNLHFDWAHEQAIGTATISFSPLVKDLRSVEFDAANMTFVSVKLSSGAALKYETD